MSMLRDRGDSKDRAEPSLDLDGCLRASVPPAGQAASLNVGFGMPMKQLMKRVFAIP